MAKILHGATGREGEPREELKKVWDTIVESGRKYAKDKKSPCPLMYVYHGTEYLGNYLITQMNGNLICFLVIFLVKCEFQELLMAYARYFRFSSLSLIF